MAEEAKESQEEKEIEIGDIEKMSSDDIDSLLGVSDSDPSRSVLKGDSETESTQNVEAPKEQAEEKEKPTEEADAKSNFFEGAASTFNRDSIDESAKAAAQGYNELSNKLKEQALELGGLRNQNETLKLDSLKDKALIDQAAEAIQHLDGKSKEQREEDLKFEDVDVSNFDDMDTDQLKDIFAKQNRNMAKMAEYVKSVKSSPSVDVASEVKNVIGSINAEQAAVQKSNQNITSSIKAFQDRFEEFKTEGNVWEIFDKPDHKEYEKAQKVREVFLEAKNKGFQNDMSSYYLGKLDRGGHFKKREEEIAKKAKEALLNEMREKPKKVKTLGDVATESAQDVDFEPKSVEDIGSASTEQINKALGINNTGVLNI